MKGYSARRSNITSEVLTLLQYSSYFENSCRVVLERLCSYTKTEVGYITILEDSAHTTYKYFPDRSDISTTTRTVDVSKALYPEITERLKKTSMVFRDSKSTLLTCDADFDAIGYKNCLCYAVKADWEIVAYIIVCDNSDNREWNDEELAVICDFAHVIAGLLVSRKTQDELRRTNMTFKTVVDNMQSSVFVTEMNTGKIIFSNKKLCELIGENPDGKHTGDVFGSRFVPSGEDFGAPSRSFGFYYARTGQWFDVFETTVAWLNGKPARLTTLNNISEKIEYERVIEKQALYDSLTELPNRRKLELDFPRYLRDSIAMDKNSHVLLLDLDDFKNINDTKGHSYGDVLLKRIAAFLKTFEKDKIAAYRFGGDEFLLIMTPKCKRDADEFSKTLMSYFNKEWATDNGEFYCTASIGIARFPEGEDSYSEIIKRCDMSVFQAKKLGKNTAVKYHDEIKNEIYRRIELENCMRNDVQDNCRNFSVHYQPIINSKTLRIEACEALLRWNCRGLGDVKPSEFIPVAEEMGFISQIGEFVLKKASAQCRKWVDSGFDIKVNINLSIGQLAQPDFVSNLRKITEKTNAPCSNLVLEVTESMAVNDMAKTKEVLSQISKLGIKIALDDFGTGYSSLNCLKEMPLSSVKIDKTFIDDIVINPSTEVFVRTIVNLSHDLKMRVCAEGVEEKAQFDILKKLDADVIQGFYFGRPKIAEEFEREFLTS